jgi:hypothetical protein
MEWIPFLFFLTGSTGFSGLFLFFITFQKKVMKLNPALRREKQITNFINKNFSLGFEFCCWF